MSVIINELEVVLEQPSTPAATTPAAAQPSSRPIQPIDIVEILERWDRSEYRLTAH